MKNDLLDLAIRLEELSEAILGDANRKIANEDRASVGLIAREISTSSVGSRWRATNLASGGRVHACNGDQLPHVVVTESL